jgi:GNAT superfamily N-acetyltransferase
VSAPVRRATAGDAPAIAAFWHALIDFHAAIDPVHGLRDGAGGALAAEVRRALADPDAALWIGEEAGRSVGFCLVRHERAPALAHEGGRALVTELFVAPAVRRRGVGRALVRAALDWARARGALRVEVRVVARNDAGQSFWRALGFGDFVDVLDRRL